MQLRVEDVVDVLAPCFAVGFVKQNCHLECKNIVFVQNFVSAEKNNVGNVFSFHRSL